ncbi:MAG: DUF2007 domain-containing protein [Burkholderiales bacterium]
MKRLYTASNRLDAWLLRDRLAHADIDSHVFNQHMQAIVGEVPPDVAGPQVWVDDDIWSKASAVLAEFHAERARGSGARKQCRHCGEENPGNFELCWKCGGSL